MQGNVYCCNLNWADFVVYFGRDNLFCERIKVDSEWQKKNIPKLDHFHKTAILPELFTQRAKGGKKLYGMYEERLRKLLMQSVQTTASAEYSGLLCIAQGSGHLTAYLS